MPHGIFNAYLFQVFNAKSWSLILGTPMLLYLKRMDASGTVLGIAVALIPFFSILQIPGANFAERVGYKTFLIRGWTFRSIFILGIAIAALLPLPISPRFRIMLVLLNLACFAIARGASLCCYLPWITHLVPEQLRGSFIAKDTMCMHLAITGTMILSSLWLLIFPSINLHGFLFLFSYIFAMVSLVFLRRVPDVDTPVADSNSTHPPWRAMLFFPPFFRYVLFNVVFNIFVAALGVIWVPYMKDSYNASGSLILGLSAYASILAAGASLLTGPVTDRVGSRPLLGFSSGLILIGQALWMALSAGAIPRHILVPFAIITFGAIGFAMFVVANTRLLMGIVPVMGRSHFFAISSVAISLTLGFFPILWGVLFDSISQFGAHGFALSSCWTWNRYSLLYAAVLAGMLISQFLRHRLDEPRAMSTGEFMRMVFVRSSGRLVGRVFYQRRRLLPPP